MAKKDKKEEPLKTEEQQAEETVVEEKQDNEAIDALQKELDKTKDLLMRTAAEYDNFRRRSQREKDALYTDSKADVLTKLLPIIDNFERAATAQTDLEQYRKGIEMTVRQLLDTMQSLDCVSFGEVGEAFDPNYHNAVMHIEDENLGENVIANVFVKGYKIGDRVIRAASVQVAN